jgi:hypothetical protein
VQLFRDLVRRVAKRSHAVMADPSPIQLRFLQEWGAIVQAYAQWPASLPTPPPRLHLRRIVVKHVPLPPNAILCRPFVMLVHNDTDVVYSSLVRNGPQHDSVGPIATLTLPVERPLPPGNYVLRLYHLPCDSRPHVLLCSFVMHTAALLGQSKVVVPALHLTPGPNVAVPRQAAIELYLGPGDVGSVAETDADSADESRADQQPALDAENADPTLPLGFPNGDEATASDESSTSLDDDERTQQQLAGSSSLQPSSPPLPPLPPPPPRGTCVVHYLDALPVTLVPFEGPLLDMSCSVCVSEFECEDEVKTLPCLHMFHTSCIDCWLREKPVCPVCLINVIESTKAVSVVFFV